MGKSRKYYYIISGLPELKFGEKLPFTTVEFFEEYGDELKNEKDLIDIIVLKNDLQNLKLIWKEKANEKNIYKPSIYSLEELKEEISSKDNFPEFISNFIDKYETNEDYLNNFSELEKEYFIFGSNTDNPFLKEFFQFELDFRNAISVIRAKNKEETDILKYTSGEGEDIILTKIKNNKSVPDFGISGDAEWITKLIQAFEKEDPLNIEKTLDRIRFEQIDEIVNLMDFEVEKILAFLVKLLILERWEQFNKEKGGQIVKGAVKEIL